MGLYETLGILSRQLTGTSLPFLPGGSSRDKLVLFKGCGIKIFLRSLGDLDFEVAQGHPWRSKTVQADKFRAFTEAYVVLWCWPAPKQSSSFGPEKMLPALRWTT